MKFQDLLYNVLFCHTIYAASIEVTTTEDFKLITVNLEDTISQCSSRLSDIVQNLCSNKYKINKRDTSSMLIKKMLPEDLKNHINKRRLAESDRWRRARRQIADECCNNSCTFDNLTDYCENSSSFIKAHPELFDENVASEVTD